jgi:hypothetical protein
MVVYPAAFCKYYTRYMFVQCKFWTAYNFHGLTAVLPAKIHAWASDERARSARLDSGSPT